MSKNQRTRFDTQEARADLIASLETLRDSIPPGNEEAMEAFAHIETFSAIALRVFAKTNASKIRSESVTVEILSLQRPVKL